VNSRKAVGDESAFANMTDFEPDKHKTDKGSANKQLPEFHLSCRYPNATSIFAISVPPLAELKNDAVFAVDTNVLLLPYKLKAERLAEIARPFRLLLGDSRLFIPGHVAREFARQRENKLSDLYHDLSVKMSVSISKAEYSFLEELPEFLELQKVESLAIEKLGDYRQALSGLRKSIESWRWNDPVSALYRELFTPSVVIDSSLPTAEIKKDQERRWTNNISPGYKDRSKDDTGIGDVIIWNTLIELGQTHKKPLVFVTGEAKSDWMVQSDKRGLFARFELVAEYYEASGGHPFEILTFSELLTLFDAQGDLIDEVKEEEVREKSAQSESQPIRYEPETPVSGATLYFPPKDAEKLAPLATEHLKRDFPGLIFSTDLRLSEKGYVLDIEFEKVIALRVLGFILGKLDERGIHVKECSFWPS
jgi:hypothetical protein